MTPTGLKNKTEKQRSKLTRTSLAKAKESVSIAVPLIDFAKVNASSPFANMTMPSPLTLADGCWTAHVAQRASRTDSRYYLLSGLQIMVEE